MLQLALAATAPLADAAQEKVWNGAAEASITVLSKNPQFKISNGGITFHFDAAAQGALSLANISANLHTEPKDLTLSFDPNGGLLIVDFDKEKKELRVFLRGSPGTPVCKLPLPALSSPSTRVLLRQRDQLALFAIPQDGSHATLVWLGTVDYVINLRNAAQYELCRDLKIAMGKRALSFENLRDGIKMDTLDEAADITVSGLNPGGEPFQHRYKFSEADLEKLIDRAFGNFIRFAGNGPAESDNAKSQSSPTPKSSPASTPEPASEDEPETAVESK